ncbi:hypothetical protein BKN38_07485 [Helicobacter sp. CLO-3]|nr:hypothetical protein BKN38_07485 [Helicobacter sp. CLO-3]
MISYFSIFLYFFMVVRATRAQSGQNSAKIKANYNILHRDFSIISNRFCNNATISNADLTSLKYI